MLALTLMLLKPVIALGARGTPGNAAGYARLRQLRRPEYARAVLAGTLPAGGGFIWA